MLTGSLGMLPSASLGEKQSNGKQFALYEPVHGSAPDIAGKNIANPLATILSFSMMMRYSFGFINEANMLDLAVENVLNLGFRTADIASASPKIVSCSEMANNVINQLEIILNK
jgi:3-isopropylmalate dehydrogenase